MNSPITTHVLDTMAGKPASGVMVLLQRQHEDGAWQQLASSTTDNDGRIVNFLPAGSPPVGGVYRLVFRTEEYFSARNTGTFYPEVAVVFRVDKGGHYHVPLLISPFGYSTYRGS